MSDEIRNPHENDDGIEEKELTDILNGLDDNLINRQIDEMMAEKGETINMDNIKGKAFDRLEESKRKRGIGKKAAVVVIAAALTVSTVYAKDIQKAVQSFFGKSTVYHTVVDGDAYYLPESLALGEKYTLEYANMSEGNLDITIASAEDMTDEWYENLELTVAGQNGVKYEAGGYGGLDGMLNVYFYEIPTLAEFDITIGGEVYPVSLTKADSLAVDESLVVGVSEREAAVVADAEANKVGGEAVTEEMPLIANIAASRNDDGEGVQIGIVVGFDDTRFKLNAFGESEAAEYKRVFENDENGVLGSGSGAMTNPLAAYDEDGNAYELKEPANTVGRPVTVFETDASPGTPLTLRIPEIQAHYEETVDKITLSIPKEGAAEIGKEIDLVAQKAILESIRRTSETTAEVSFRLNTGADKSVKIRDLSAYSPDVIKGEAVITGDTAVLTLTFDENTESAELQFSWPYFVIEGDWVIELK